MHPRMRQTALLLPLFAMFPYTTAFTPIAAPLAISHPTRTTERCSIFPVLLLPACARFQRTTGIAAGTTDKDFARALDTAEEVVRGLRSRTAHDDESVLDLATDFYDPSTGLHSEGVWHNALIGIACLGLICSERAGEEVKEAPRRIAASLWKHSWDGKAFRRRSHSGRWDHSVLAETSTKLEQPAYYRASEEHRCVQHGMACLFWSFLREVDPGASEGYNDITAAFIEQFWDEDAAYWTTISRTQGVATAARPSASTGQSRPPEEGGTEGEGFFEAVGGVDQVYYRAVDHAVALLALVSMEKRWEAGDAVPRDRLQELTRLTAQQLLSPAGFGYGGDYSVAEPNPWTRSYIGLDRRRNFWHDAWVVLGLLGARGVAAGAVQGLEDAELKSLVAQLASVYGAPDGTIWHWAAGQRAEAENVRYCGDNALYFAICSALQWAPEPQGGSGGDGEPPSRTQERINQKKAQKAFWDFVGQLRAQDEDGLASVGDVYRQVRLHPNSELAALLLWRLL